MTNTQQDEAQTMADSDQLAIELGVVIQSLMFRKRITQTQLAKAMGLTQSAISQKLHGRTSVTVGDLYAIAGVLGVHPGDLLPRLDSNQQPSGYTSPLVSAAVAHYSLPAMLWLAGQFDAALSWLDQLDADWLAPQVPPPSLVDRVRMVVAR